MMISRSVLCERWFGADGVGAEQRTGGTDRRIDVPSSFIIVKSGEGRVAPVYSREISKIFAAKFSDFKNRMEWNRIS
jgi:hypothetical protein